MIITGAKCDKCGTVKWADGVYTKKEMTVVLRKKGWTVGKRTICSDCVPKRKTIIVEE